ncbi:sugar porter family MFS transporter [Actinotignum urinale]|uniref:sugar porter family MFS transporter n=1 Tax=Actinotignum urinale TaxID=190146 RepID=UPI002A833D51|nr:sugar porter family MFS transporter [Actinotignum urinale]MDY5129850.1 sugar porter family MFS transporter [Actinotignum urinale]
MMTSPSAPRPAPASTAGGPGLVSIACTAALGFFLFGYDTAVINGGIDALSDHFGLSTGMRGFAVSSALLGCVVGAWFAGSLANRFGRTRLMVVAAILFLISAIGSATAFGTIDFILWRIIGGIGVGNASVIAPTYIAEVAPARSRGKLSSLQGLAGVVGIAAALFVNAAMAWTAGGAAENLWLGIPAWRWMFVAEALPALVYGVFALRVPESPRFLVAIGREADAAQILRRVGAADDIPETIERIRRSLAGTRRMRLSDLRGAALGLQPIVWVGILVAVAQQFVGINVIFYYSTTLWRSVGFDESNALGVTAITSLINIGSTVLSLLIIDRVGRRRLLIVGALGMAATLGAMAIAFSQAVTADGAVVLPEPWGIIALVASLLFVAFFGTTWGSVMWVLLGEMFPNRIRGAAMSVATAVNWIANFLVSATFPVLAALSLSVAYGFYAVSALVAFFLVRRFVRETSGVEIEDMRSSVAAE